MNLRQDNPAELPKNPKPEANPRRPRIKFPLMAAVIAVLILTGVVAGFLPRFLRHTELGAETQKLSVPAVDFILTLCKENLFSRSSSG